MNKKREFIMVEHAGISRYTGKPFAHHYTYEVASDKSKAIERVREAGNRPLYLVRLKYKRKVPLVSMVYNMGRTA